MISHWHAHEMPRRIARTSACIVAALGIHSAAIGAAPDCGTETLTREQARTAVAFVSDRVASAHVGSLQGMAPALQDGFRLLRNSISEPVAAAPLALSINRVLAHAADAHLRLKMTPSAAATCRQLPLSLTWSDRGLLVRSGAGIPAGSRVLAIGKYSLDEIDRIAVASIPHENRYWAHSEFARLLPRADTLSSLELLNQDDSVDISYQPRDGAPSTQRLRLSTTVTPPRPWIGYQSWPASSTAVLWLERCDLNDEFHATLSRFVAEVRRLGIRKVAIDVRGNTGGDSGVALAIMRAFGRAPPNAFSVDVRVSSELNAAQPAFDPKNMFPLLEPLGLTYPTNARSYRLPGSLVLSMLTQRLPLAAPEAAPPVELYLLIDGGTFSSAALFAILMRDNHLGMLIGEPTGNPPSFNASEIHLGLPHSPYYLNLSTASLIRPDVDAGPAETILPDVLAPLTADALAAGSDPALDFVRAR